LESAASLLPLPGTRVSEREAFEEPFEPEDCPDFFPLQEASKNAQRMRLAARLKVRG
jgi:hypothetical protein